ncbi:hypothetical protein E1263_37640 [Kribbella antibiotica]|uniref:WD40 repeat domain-containing protein n=1 Tax=Kribbella antibiotica TaxID=190195 RepID=A0A4R4YP64_9ACTN|nr:hypothetical protein [Kribbella antibiotica]TDD45929.1 hypothetical protein E1263_37640 [Kribbella antibiotica]
MRRVIAAVVVAASALTACSSKNDDPPAPQTVYWEKVDVGAEPVALAEHDGRILVGVKHKGAKVVPGVVLINGSERKTLSIKPSAASPYSFEAIWYSLAWDGKRVLGLGGASGGAHGNVRWTVWTGSVDTGLQEHPQTFDTFNGLSAGQMTSAVLTPAGQALTGSWEGIVTGLDASVWLPQANNKWLRQDPAKTPLQNTKNLLVGTTYATAYGDGLLLTGSQVRLEPNVVQQGAAVWRSEKLAQNFTRVELPDPGSRSQANTATCADTCVISGFVDNKLAIWRYDGAKAQQLSGVPEIPVGDKDVLPPPFTDGTPDGNVIQIIAQDNKVKIVHGREGHWTTLESKGDIQGPVTAAVRAGDDLTIYLIAGGALWKTSLS